YYVGATRARKMLVTAGNSATRVGYLDSRRVYRFLGERKAQLEVGRDGDVDKLAHLAWSSSSKTQRALAAHVGQMVPVKARAMAQEDYALRIFLEQKDADGVTRVIEIGQLSSSFRSDLWNLSNRIDSDRPLKPGESIPHLYLMAVATVGVAEDQRGAV